MSSALVSKETAILRREPLLKVLLLSVVLLLAVSVLTGIQREQVFSKERSSAELTDREVWLEQGERNPHSAAHFSRYAFRPLQAIALLDPGVSDFAGLAVWMEAHYQDPADFRRAEDASELSRYVQLSPAFLLLTAAPLLVIVLLHGSIAGEHEDGTLRQLLASGVGYGELFSGKFFSGWRLTMLVYSAAFGLLATVAAATAPGVVSADTAFRLALMYVVYAVYLTIWVAVAIAGSALCRTRRTALIVLAGGWIVMTILAPRLGSGLAMALHPQPDARAVANQLSAASRIWWDDKAMQEQEKQAQLEQYGVEDVADLPFDFNAYALQQSEEVSNPAFDKVYRELGARYHAQESALRLFAFASPAVVTATLSRALAGTDRAHHEAFTAAAEAHRRVMIKMLNDDFMHHAGDAGYGYTAGREVWELCEALDFSPPSFDSVAGRYIADGMLLLIWLAGAWLAARWLVWRTLGREVATS